MWYHYKRRISLHSKVKLIRPPRRNHVISKWHKLLIINSSSKSYYLWPIQWCNLKFRIIQYNKGISLNFKVMYLRVSTLQTVFCGVFGVSILSYARLISADAIKSSNYECVNFREDSFNSYIFQCRYRRYRIDIDITIWGFEYRHASCGCRCRLDIVMISTISIYMCTSAFDSG